MNRWEKVRERVPQETKRGKWGTISSAHWTGKRQAWTCWDPSLPGQCGPVSTLLVNQASLTSAGSMSTCGPTGTTIFNIETPLVNMESQGCILHSSLTVVIKPLSKCLHWGKLSSPEASISLLNDYHCEEFSPNSQIKSVLWWLLVPDPLPVLWS